MNTRETNTLDWTLLHCFAVRCWLTWQDLFDITRWTKRDHRELFRITSSLRTGLYRIDELWSSRIFMIARGVLFKAHYSSFCLSASVYKDISQVSLFHCSTFLSCIKKIHMLFFSFSTSSFVRYSRSSASSSSSSFSFSCFYYQKDKRKQPEQTLRFRASRWQKSVLSVLTFYEKKKHKSIGVVQVILFLFLSFLFNV